MKTIFRLLVLTVVAAIACNPNPTPAPTPPAPGLASDGGAAQDEGKWITPRPDIVPPSIPPLPMPSWLVVPRPPLGSVRAAAGTRPPIIPPSWTVPAWFVDPSNSSSVASDTNTCTTSGAPCLTYSEIAARWGTYSPRLRQTTTITFLSSHTTNADPVYLAPYLENQASLIVKGVPTTVATGTLAGVVNKNRATPQLLNATMPAGTAVNEFVQNTTRGSNAWTYKSLGGGNFSLSQPVTQRTPPAAITGGEDNTWANTDAVTVSTLPNINIPLAEAIVAPDSGASGAALFLNLLNVWDPAGAGTLNTSVFGPYTALIDVTSTRLISFLATGFNANNVAGSYDANFQDGLITMAPEANQFSAGIVGVFMQGNSAIVDDDVILNGNVVFHAGSLANTWDDAIGIAYIETAKSITLLSGNINIAASRGAGAPILWGPGSINAAGGAHLQYASGANQAVAIFVLTGGIKISGATTACSHSGANNPDVVNCAIALTAANLDAAQGLTGFGGNAFQLGGGSISNF